MSTCDFRVQCGRCSGGAQDACTGLWAVTAAAYGIAAVSINIQLYRQQEDAPLIQTVLALWSGAYYARMIGALILCLHFDKHLPPVVMEILWHSCWLLGCIALTLFMVKLSGAAYYIQNIGNSRRKGSMVSKKVILPNPFTWCTEKLVKRLNSTIPLSVFWCTVFLALSIYDGLRPNWPQPGVQWLVWAVCTAYLLVTNWIAGAYIIPNLNPTEKPQKQSNSASPVSDTSGDSKTSPKSLRGSSISSWNLKRMPSLAGSANITYDANQAKKYIIRRLLVYVLNAIKYGYLAYTITLLALGITYLAFKNNLSVVAETCIQAWLQLGMLLMGVVIQVAVYWTGVANDMIRQAARARRLQIQAAWQRNHGKKRGRHFVVEKLTEQNSPGASNASSQVQNAAIGPLGQSRNVSGAESYVEMTVVNGSAMNKTGETQREQKEPSPLQVGRAPKRKTDSQPRISVRNPNHA